MDCIGLQMVPVSRRFRIGMDPGGRLPSGLTSNSHGQVDGWEEGEHTVLVYKGIVMGQEKKRSVP